MQCVRFDHSFWRRSERRSAVLQCKVSEQGITDHSGPTAASGPGEGADAVRLPQCLSEVSGSGSRRCPRLLSDLVGWLCDIVEEHPSGFLQTCCVKSQLGDAAFSLVLGWWGIPWGLLMTPVQIIRNFVALVRGSSSDGPSASLERMIGLALAAEMVKQGQVQA